MVVSIVLTGRYNIGVNGNNKIKVNDKLIEMKDIPFIRYRFNEYTEEDIEFIKKNKEKFNGPIHLIEISLNDKTRNVLDMVNSMEDVPKFIYVPINDEDIAMGIKDNTLELLKGISDYFFDRVMIKDNTSMLYPLAADKIKFKIEEALNGAIPARDIGICGSPLSFRNNTTEGQACLTAVWARKIMAEYSSTPDIVVPSASHECMTCCGCIQYFVVDHDLPAPLSSKEKAASKDNKETKDKEPKDKKPAIKNSKKHTGIPVFRL